MVTGESVARQHRMIDVSNDSGGEEEEKSKGGSVDQMAEAEKGRLL